jgi:hypothetical protein
MKTLLQNLNEIKYEKLIWILAISETIHNIEEAIWLPDLFQSKNILHSLVSPFEFRFATIIITLLIYWIIYYFVQYKNNLSRYLMCGTLFMILFNVFMPHIIASVLLLKYVSGIISGIILNIPVTFYLLRRGFKEGIFEIKSLIIGSIAFGAIAIPFLFGSFFIEEFIAKLF